MSRGYYIRSVLWLALVSVGIYANTLWNGFVYDDRTTIVSNFLIKDLANLPTLFHRDYFYWSGEMTYRPVVTFSYFLENAVFGMRPWGFHLSNVLLHAVNGIIFYIFCILLLNRSDSYHDSRIKPLAASLIFVTHPILTEAVNAISYREDLLVFSFYMASICLYLLSKKNRGYKTSLLVALSGLLYMLALFSKEMAVTLPLIIFSYEFLQEGRIKWRSILTNRAMVLYTAITFLYFCIRFWILQNPAEGDNASWSIWERFQTLPLLMVSYMKMAAFPVLLSADYEIMPIKTFFSFSFIAYFSITTLFLIAAIKNSGSRISFGLLFFVLTLIPVLNLIPILSPWAERYLYLPTAGLALFLGWIAAIPEKPGSEGKKSFIIYLFTISMIVIIYSFTVVNRNKVWKDDYTLWADTVNKMPESSHSHLHLGLALKDKGKLAEAVKEYEKAIALDPMSAESHINLGNIYLRLGLAGLAVREFLNAQRLKPMDPLIYNNLGTAYYRSGDLDGSINAYREAIKLNPYMPEVHYNLGLAYFGKKKLNDAVMEYRIALRLNPGMRQAEDNLQSALKARMMEGGVH